MKAIVPQIYPETESVSAFGGEDLTPPSFGKVFVSVKPLMVSSYQVTSNKISNNHSKSTVLLVLFLKLLILSTCTLRQTQMFTTTPTLHLTSESVKDVVTGNIVKYSDSVELNKFGARFKYSKFQKIVDDSSESITSNITTVTMRRDMESVVKYFC